MNGPLRVLLVVVPLTVLPALLSGKYLNRWGDPPDLPRAAHSLERLPVQLGDWHVVHQGQSLSDFVCRELGLHGYLSRVYAHRLTGAEVHILVMVGQPGRLVRHPPTVCYANRNNQQIGPIELVALPQESTGSRFRMVEYRRPNQALDERFVVAYAHTVDGTWDAPDSPRIAYGGSPFLYKVQLLTQKSPADEVADADPPIDAARERLEQFAVEFDRQFRDIGFWP
jgi:hypothetical protein